MAIFSVSLESYIARANSTYNLSSMFQVGSAGGTLPTLVGLHAYDRNEYAGRETYNYGSLSSGSSSSSYRSGNYFIAFTLRDGQYVSMMGEPLSSFTFTASSDENRLQNLNFIAYNESFQIMERRNLQIVTRSTYVDSTPGAATSSEIGTVARSYIGQVWDSWGCWNLASVISASAGASLCLNSGWITGDISANGQWTVAYSGYSGLDTNWYSTLRAGDMVEMGWTGGGGHIVTVSRVENGQVYIVDNSGPRLTAQQMIDFERADGEDLLVAERNFSSYVGSMDQRTVIVHRLAEGTTTVAPEQAPAPGSDPGAADDTMATARMLGTFGNEQTGSASVSDAVGATDRLDFFKFQLTSRSEITLALSDLSADADLYLYNDTGQLQAYSVLAGTNTDRIASILDAGSYYVRVMQYEGDTTYNLGLSQTLAAPSVTAISRSFKGSTSVSAASLFSVTGNATSYSFRDTSMGGGSLTMNGTAVAAGAWVTVSAADLGTVGFTSVNADAIDGIELTAANGSSWSAVATAWLTNALDDDTMATARTLGTFGSEQTGSASVSDKVGANDWDDFFTFQLTSRSQIALTLSGLSADANLILYNDKEQMTAYSALAGANTERISSTLNAGTYYVHVMQYQGDTTYNLALSQTLAAPSVTAVSRSFNGSTSVSAASLFLVTGNATSYSFRDTSMGGGSLTMNGTDVAAGAWVTVSAADLGTVGFTSVNADAIDGIELTAANGSSWSAVATAWVTSEIYDDTMATARTLGTFGSSQTGSASVSDKVGANDWDDFFTFQLTSRSQIALTLSGLSADANLILYNDKEQMTAYSVLAGTNAERISSTLDAGTYYVRVMQYQGDTTYNLALSQTLTAPSVTAISRSFKGSTAISAASLFSVTGSATSYSFRDTSMGGGSLTMNGTAVAAGTWVTVSAADLGTVGFTSVNADAIDGIELMAANGSSWSAVATAWVTNVLDDDAAATARMLGTFGSKQTGWASVSDKARATSWQDFFKFQLTSRSQIALTLSGLSADANLYLYNDKEQLQAYSVLAGANTDRIASILDAGSYYVRVMQYEGDTTYNLGLSQTLAAPSVTAISRSFNGSTSVSAASLFSVTGNATSYSFRDTSMGGGSLTMNGTAVVAGTWVTVSAADLGTVGFTSVNADAIDRIEIVAANGSWSSVVATVGNALYDDTAAASRTLGTIGKTLLRINNTVNDGDQMDYWNFSVTSTGSVRLNLSNMSNDADLFIFNSAGDVVGYSVNSGTASEDLTGTLSAGTYYAAVRYYGGTTCYSLQASNGSAVTALAGGASGASFAYRDSVGLGNTLKAASFMEDAQSAKQVALLAAAH